VVKDTDTATRMLDSAEELVQRRGFNGFSYADVAGDLGVTKASLHYHFRSKAELFAAAAPTVQAPPPTYGAR